MRAPSDHLEELTEDQLSWLAPFLVEGFDECYVFKMQLLQERGWFAVPLESHYFFDETQAGQIAKAVRGIGVSEIYAAPLRVYYQGQAFHPRMSIAEMMHALRINPTTEGLVDFDFEGKAWDYLVTDRKLQFALLFRNDDHHVFAGPKAFLEAILGLPIADAFQAFRSYAEGFTADRGVREHMLSVCDIYSRCAGIELY